MDGWMDYQMYDNCHRIVSEASFYRRTFQGMKYNEVEMPVFVKQKPT